MPWKVEKHSGCDASKPWGVVSTVSGKLHGCHESKAKARMQQKALYARGVAATEEEEVMNDESVAAPLTTATNAAKVMINLAKEGLTEEQKSNGAIGVLTLSNGTNFGDAVALVDEALAEEGALPTWEAVLAFEGLPTSDKRLLMTGEITHRDLPLTLMAQTVTDEGHDGAEVAGNITEIWRDERPDLGANVVAIMGRGNFADNEKGREAAKLVENEMLRGVSVDAAPSEVVFLDNDTQEPVDEDSIDLGDVLAGKYLKGIKGEIMGATLVPFPAFGDAHMQVIYEDKAMVASAPRVWSVQGEPQLWLVAGREPLTAAAAHLAPLAPPKDWFELAEPDIPCPLTVTDDGRVYGHLALWGQCHSGFAVCEVANKSKSGYAYFHTGQLTTAEGDDINVGRITVGDRGGARGGHASIVLGTQGAIEHYDNTACVGAYVRAKDGKLGIWLSGAVRSDCPAERVRDMKANPPSGDWRFEKGCRELVAALCVPVGGFAIPRYEARVASAADGEEEIMALVATGYVEEEPPANSRSAQRRIPIAIARAKRELGMNDPKDESDAEVENGAGVDMEPVA